MRQAKGRDAERVARRLARLDARPSPQAIKILAAAKGFPTTLGSPCSRTTSRPPTQSSSSA
jgi:hypothetical protein